MTRLQSGKVVRVMSQPGKVVRVMLQPGKVAWIIPQLGKWAMTKFLHGKVDRSLYGITRLQSTPPISSVQVLLSCLQIFR